MRIDKGLILKALGERSAGMFGVFFSVLVVIALASILGEILMRVLLTRRETSREKLAWWGRGGDEVAATYGEIFPGSRLLFFRRFVFWLLVACAGILVLSMLLWKSH
jgi:hypothetical protein